MLIEDCAQALGARLGDQYCGTFGDIGCYSFHSQKNLTTLGEGGMLTVRNPEWRSKIRGRAERTCSIHRSVPLLATSYGNVDLDIDGMWPFKSTMSEVQTAVGELLLDRLDLLLPARERDSHFRRPFTTFQNCVFKPSMWMKPIVIICCQHVTMESQGVMPDKLVI